VDLRPGPPTFTPCNAEINSFAQLAPLNPILAILAGSLLSWTASFFRRPAISLSRLFLINIPHRRYLCVFVVSSAFV
jgi:hypothetical protein